MKELMMDKNRLGRRDLGDLLHEFQAVAQGKRKAPRMNSNKKLAHKRGMEASKGFDYGYADLQDKDLHDLQHRYDANGRKQKMQPKALNDFLARISRL